MWPPDDALRLGDMLDYARRAIDSTQGRTRADLDHDYVFAAALERFVEIVGEAANGVSGTSREQLPGVPWRQMIAMRNRLVHGYSTIDRDVLWDTVRNDLPKLAAALEARLGPI